MLAFVIVFAVVVPVLAGLLIGIQAEAVFAGAVAVVAVSVPVLALAVLMVVLVIPNKKR